MMEEDQDQGFMCKVCNKSFFSDKSLGGHMRSHISLISSKIAEKDNNPNMGFEDNNVCKECGKGFQSLRALAGHMRCHSMKGKGENVCKKCGKRFDTIKGVFGHMKSHSKKYKASDQSEFRTDFPIPNKRSRTRYLITPNPSFSNFTNSSSVTENDDVNEVAMCLMMLSRGLNKSMCLFEKKIEYDDKIKKHRQDDESGNELGDADIENGINNRTFGLESGIELGDSDIENGISNPTIGLESGLELGNFDIEKGINNPAIGLESGIELGDSDIENGISNPTIGMESGLELGDFDIDDIENSVEQEIELKRGKEYECSICFKVFGSGQALGGHKRAHYIGLTESRAKEAMLIEQELSDDIHNVFDLNLPVTLEDGEQAGDVGFEPR